MSASGWRGCRWWMIRAGAGTYSGCGGCAGFAGRTDHRAALVPSMSNGRSWGRWGCAKLTGRSRSTGWRGWHGFIRAGLTGRLQALPDPGMARAKFRGQAADHGRVRSRSAPVMIICASPGCSGAGQSGWGAGVVQTIHPEADGQRSAGSCHYRSARGCRARGR